MAFQRSNEVGGFAERLVRKLFSSAGAQVLTNESRRRTALLGWDLEVLLYRTPFRVEVKFDVMASRTGNLAIEYYNTRLGSPSGIGATTADLWCVVLLQPLAVYLTSVADLRAYCELHRPWRNVPCGGDGNAAMWLYPAHDILDAIFHRVDDLDPRHLPSVVCPLLGETHRMEHAEYSKGLTYGNARI